MTHGGLSGVKIVKGALALFAQAAQNHSRAEFLNSCKVDNPPMLL